MSSEPVIRFRDVSKCYFLYDRPSDRLKEFFWRGKKSFHQEFWALRNIDLEIARGEVIGIIGCNGSGKSTLLQLVCGTLSPNSGDIQVRGRIAALLELGAGFNMEFTGRENVWMNASILGLSQADIAERFDDIVDFSGIGDFIDQPVKTYSSGMYVRLAFAVATSIDPDILIIDEALSVGDGAFARKSFDRIMQLKNAGKTILFCSHASYHIEAICDRAIWLDSGRVKQIGHPAAVMSAYEMYLAELSTLTRGRGAPNEADSAVGVSDGSGCGRISRVECRSDEQSGKILALHSGVSPLQIYIHFRSDPALPTPSVAVAIATKNGQLVTSASSRNDDTVLHRQADGSGFACLTIPNCPFLKGVYVVNVFLGCEQALHVYDHAEYVSELHVTQKGLAQGLVNVPHRWTTG